MSDNLSENPSLPRYFDNAATTPLDPRVLERMLPYLRDGFGNANSLHSFGRRAHDAVEKAREQVARLIGAEDPSQIYFTAGATEANNWIARSFTDGIVSPYEHSSMLNSAQQLGWSVWDSDLSSCSDEREIASLMTVNNETGTVYEIRDLPRPATYLHADATQAVGKLPFTVDGLSFASMSAHKLYGPKGVGALYCSEFPPSPLLIGGEQEQGYRSGTLNVAGIVGFGVAAEIAQAERKVNLIQAMNLRNLLVHELEGISDYQILGGPKTSPFILSLSFLGVEGETLVIETDRAGYAISSGAACSSRSTEPSHVLTAMGIEPSVIRGAVRISFGKHNNLDSTAGLAGALTQSVEKLRTFTMNTRTLRNARQGNARH